MSQNAPGARTDLRYTQASSPQFIAKVFQNSLYEKTFTTELLATHDEYSFGVFTGGVGIVEARAGEPVDRVRTGTRIRPFASVAAQTSGQKKRERISDAERHSDDFINTA